MPQPGPVSSWGFPAAEGGHLVQDSPGVGMVLAALGFHGDLRSIPGARTMHTRTPQDATTWETGEGNSCSFAESLLACIYRHWQSSHWDANNVFC